MTDKSKISVYADLIEGLGKNEFFVLNGNLFSDEEILEIQKELIKRNNIKIDSSLINDTQIVAKEDLGAIIDGFNFSSGKIYKINDRIVKENGKELFEFHQRLLNKKEQK